MVVVGGGGGVAHVTICLYEKGGRGGGVTEKVV